MENSFQKLTALQHKVGYTKGDINTIALFGLFGEAGEVLGECKAIMEDGKEPIPVLKEAVNMAKIVDDNKKMMRDKKIPTLKIIVENEEAFDKEIADTLYYLNALAISRDKTLEEYAEISYQKVLAKQQTDISHGTLKQ